MARAISHLLTVLKSRPTYTHPTGPWTFLLSGAFGPSKSVSAESNSSQPHPTLSCSNPGALNFSDRHQQIPNCPSQKLGLSTVALTHPTMGGQFPSTCWLYFLLLYPPFLLKAATHCLVWCNLTQTPTLCHQRTEFLDLEHKWCL